MNNFSSPSVVVVRKKRDQPSAAAAAAEKKKKKKNGISSFSFSFSSFSFSSSIKLFLLLLKSHQQEVFLFLLTYIGYATLYSTRKPFSVVKTHMQLDLQFDTYTLGKMDTAFLAAYALGQLTLPSLSNIYTTRMVLLLSYLSSATCSLLFGLSSNTTVMNTAWLINGLSHSTAFPLMIKTLAPWFGAQHRGKVLGLWTTSQQIGAMSATAFAAYIADVFTWRAAFTIPATACGAMGLVLFFFILDPPIIEQEKLDYDDDDETKMTRMITNKEKEQGKEEQEQGKEQEQEEQGKEQEQEQGKEEQGKEEQEEQGTCKQNSKEERKKNKTQHEHEQPLTYLQIVLMPNLLNVAGAYFCVKLIRYSLLFWLPYFLTRELNYEPAVAGYSSMMFDIGGIAGAVSTGYLADTLLGGKRLTAAACMSLASGFALLAFAWANHSGLFLTLVVMGMVGFTIAGPDSVLGAAAAQDLCERSGFGLSALSIAAGFINGTGGVGAVLQGYVTAFITESYGWDTLFGTLCIMAVLAMVLLLAAVLAENRHITHTIITNTNTTRTIHATTRKKQQPPGNGPVLIMDL